MNRNRGASLSTIIIITLLAAILLAVTNPTPETHVAAINHRLAEKDTLTGMLNRGLLALKPPAYHTLALASYTEWDNKLSSIGVFGYVWVDVTVFK